MRLGAVGSVAAKAAGNFRSTSLTFPAHPAVRPLHVPFSKMQAAGNDFIVLDNRFLHFSPGELSEIARRYCPRRFGVGADGLLALDRPERPDTDYRMRYHNPDGSLAGLCGNGARCLARFAREAGLTGDPLVFDAEAGEYHAVVATGAEEPVRLYVQPARDMRAVRLPEGGYGHYVWTGTHHAVVFVDDVDSTDLERLAPPLRWDPQFAPEGTNVDFVEPVSPDAIRVRTFEKGVEAETLACGTGALASAVVARLAGRVSADRIQVQARGGSLEVGFRLNGDSVEGLYLEGPVATVYTGILALDPTTLAA